MLTSMRPKKQWGQNFLRNRGAVDRTIAAIEPQPDDVILEIGPGEGVLTEKLVDLPNPLTAIEIDPELHARLRTRFGDRLALRLEDAVEAPRPPSPTPAPPAWKTPPTPPSPPPPTAPSATSPTTSAPPSCAASSPTLTA